MRLVLSALALLFSAGNVLSQTEEVYVALPLDNIKITSLYGYRRDPMTGKRTFHNGLDLRAKYENVYAMAGGIVEKTGQDGRSGIFMTIRHGNITVTYCHLSKVMAKAGTHVRARQTVAISGNSGRSTGPHLHIIIRYMGNTVDPVPVLLFIAQKIKGTGQDHYIAK